MPDFLLLVGQVFRVRVRQILMSLDPCRRETNHAAVRSDLSERRACGLVGLSRDSFRHPPQPDQATIELNGKIVEIAHARRRFGYRRVHDMLRPQFPGVNHKRVYRLYSEANLTVRKRKKAKRPISERIPLQIAKAINEVLSVDFVKP